MGFGRLRARGEAHFFPAFRWFLDNMRTDGKMHPYMGREIAKRFPDFTLRDLVVVMADFLGMNVDVKAESLKPLTDRDSKTNACKTCHHKGSALCSCGKCEDCCQEKDHPRK